MQSTTFIPLLDPTPNYVHAGYWLALAPWVSQFPGSCWRIMAGWCSWLPMIQITLALVICLARLCALMSATQTRYLPLMVGGHHLLLTGEFVDNASPTHYRDYHYAAFGFALVTLVIQTLRQISNMPSHLKHFIERYQSYMACNDAANRPWLSLRQKDHLKLLQRLDKAVSRRMPIPLSYWDDQLMRSYRHHLLPALPYLWRQHSAFPHVGEHDRVYQPCRVAHVHRYLNFTLEQCRFFDGQGSELIPALP